MAEISDAAALKDRARGALLGLAVGDAVGTTLEFLDRDSYEHLTDMVGGGPFCLNPGEWTDDTSMALALADSLLVCDRLNETDLMERFCEWADGGAYSHNGRCFDIGITTWCALDRYQSSGNPIAGSTEANTAGNGSLMRLAPIAIRYAFSADQRREAAALQSRTTHGARDAIEACVAYADLVAEAISGRSKAEVLSPRSIYASDLVNSVMQMTVLKRSRAEIHSSGYVIHSLEAALWAFGRAKSFEEAVLLAANLGEDADTTAAITGQLAGALWGASAIPADWLAKLAWREEIVGFADRLHARSLGEDGSALQ